MEIVVLGSGTAIPDGERGSPGIAVDVQGRLVFLDLGSGSLYRAVRCGLSLDRLDAVLLTHFHPDHTADLVPLLFAFRNPEYPRQHDLLILGPSGIHEYYEQLQEVYGDWVATPGYRCQVQALTRDNLDLGSWRVRTCPVPHGERAIAYEIADPAGRRLVYAGDTDESDSLADFAAGADLLILECSFPEGYKRAGHLIPSQAGQMAGKAGCRRLLLTHFYPACRGQDLLTPCQKFYPGPILLATDGLRMQV